MWRVEYFQRVDSAHRHQHSIRMRMMRFSGTFKFALDNAMRIVQPTSECLNWRKACVLWVQVRESLQTATRQREASRRRGRLTILG